MRSSFVSLSVLLALSPSIAAAQATLVSGLGGPLGFGTEVLARGDDSISASVDLTPAFATGVDYFGTRYTSLFVNTNGNVSFGASLSEYTPMPFPAARRPIIAAWWADVDTRGMIGGEPDRNLVYYALAPGRLVATWIDVGYFRNHVDLLNAFQIILTAAPGEPDGTFDVELRYNRCEWTTGDATPGHMMGLGGIAAQAGFDGGDMVNFLTLPGSLTNDVLMLCHTSNVGMTGVWQLHPRGSAIAAICGNGLRETGEACDDGNRVPHDGCDADCQVDMPCISVMDAGFSFPDASLGDANLPDANGDDANGADATGGFSFPDTSLAPGDGGPELPDAGLLPCGSPPVDAGGPDAARPDAGSTPFPDAGRFDAGERMDAAVSDNVLTVTGSGCSCRVAGSSASGARWLWLLGAALAIRRVRERARA